MLEAVFVVTLFPSSGCIVAQKCASAGRLWPNRVPFWGFGGRQRASFSPRLDRPLLPSSAGWPSLADAPDHDRPLPPDGRGCGAGGVVTRGCAGRRAPPPALRITWLG